MVFGNADHSGPGSNIVTEGSTSQYGGSAMFPQGVNEQVNRSHARNYQAGHAPFNLHPHAPSHAGDESWSWSKGQISRDVGAVSSFLTHDGAAFDRGFARFTQGPPRMMRSFETSSVWDEARLSNDNHGNHRVWGLTSINHFPSEGSGMNGFQARDQHQSGRDETNAVPSHAWSPGRYFGDEHMSEAARNRSIETLSGCNNGLHVTNNIWHESDFFRGASSSNPSTFFPDLHSITDMGIRAPYSIHSRVQLPSGSACLHEPALQEPHHSNPSSYVNPGFQSSVLPPAPLTRQRPPPPPLLAPPPTPPPPPPPPPPLGMLSNAHSQEVLCLIPPPAYAATRSNFNFGLPPVHAAVGPRAVERTRTPSSRRVSFQASIPFPPRRSDHHQLVSLGFVDELSYNGIDWGEIYDEHRNMRMDVDSMSYEELLALGESIGHVNMGLSEDNIRTCLETIVCTGVELTSGEVKSQECDSKCSICQEEYINGDEVARLVCRHAYHTSCIKQWLFIKNQCPICKAAAYEDS